MDFKNIQRIHLFRILILILLPFLIGAVLLPHTAELKGATLVRPSEIQTGYLQSQQYVFTHVYTADQSAPEVSSVFPFANYIHFYPAVSYSNLQLCFQDEGSYLTYQNGTTETPPFQWSVEINNASEVVLFPNSVVCTKAEASNSYSLKWKANLPYGALQNEDLSQTTFTPQVVVYPKLAMDYGVLQGLVFIPAFYLFIFYPAAGIIKKIQKGLLEQ